MLGVMAIGGAANGGSANGDDVTDVIYAYTCKSEKEYA